MTIAFSRVPGILKALRAAGYNPAADTNSSTPVNSQEMKFAGRLLHWGQLQPT